PCEHVTLFHLLAGLDIHGLNLAARAANFHGEQRDLAVGFERLRVRLIRGPLSRRLADEQTQAKNAGKAGKAHHSGLPPGHAMILVGWLLVLMASPYAIRLMSAPCCLRNRHSLHEPGPRPP